MKNLWKKTLSLILALGLCFSLLPVQALAEEAEEPAVEEQTEIVTEVPAEAGGEEIEEEEVVYPAEDPQPPHVCEYTGIVTEPTCTEQGYTTYTCDCGNSYVDDVTDALGHTEEAVAEIPAEVGQPGKTEGTVCSVCGIVLSGCEEIPTLPEPEPEEEVEAEPEAIEEPPVEETVETDATNEGNIVASGNCGAQGDNLTWTLNDEGILTISGTGDMADYIYINSVNYDLAPWYPNKSSIQSAIIESGVTSIGYYAFYECTNLISLTIPSTVGSIGAWAFYNCSSISRVYIQDVASWCGIIYRDSGSFPFNYSSASEKNVFINGVLVTDLIITNTVMSLGQGAFLDWGWLTSVSLPSSITSIGNGAFRNCYSLTTITMTDSVTTIDRFAFENCSAIEEVFFDGSEENWSKIAVGDGNEYLTSATFHYDTHDWNVPDYIWADDNSTVTATRICRNATSHIEKEEAVPILTVTTEPTYESNGAGYYTATFMNSAFETQTKDVEIPKLVHEIIASGTFGNDLIWTLEDTGIMTISGNGSIPDFRTTTSVPWVSFKDSIININIEQGVTEIGTYAFHSCNNLTNVEIPSGVERIGYKAFYGCGCLNSIIIPEGVTSIAEKAFAECSSLAHLEIPESVTSFGYNVFQGCSNLKSLGPIGSGKNIEIAWTTSIPSNAFYGCNSLESIDFPTSVKRIYDNSFYMCGSLTNVEIPSGVVYIGSESFADCGNLTTIKIPASVTGIGFDAFKGCGNLRSAGPTDSGSNIEFGWTSSIPSNAFYGCNSLINVTIPSSITSIGDQAFWECYGLISAGPIGSGCSIEYGWTTSIPSNAFRYCSNLTYVEIPTSITNIGYNAFSDCYSLTSVGPIGSGCSIEYGWTKSIPNNAFYGCKSLTNITFPSGLRRIGSSAFSGCSNLTFMEIPSGVTSIGSSAFYGCSSLTSIIIPASVTDIQGALFQSCSGLTSAGPIGSGCNIEYGWTTLIPTDAFLRCSSLLNVTIAPSITSIGNDAFSGCTGLMSIDIPGSVTSIGVYAFYGCSSLTHVTIPSQVTSLDVSIFYECSSLARVDIPSSVTRISDYAFQYCYNLEDVYYQGTRTKWNNITIDTGNECLTTANIHYQADCWSNELHINKSELSLYVNKTDTLQIINGNGNAVNVTWESSNTAIATVTSAGKVKALKSGTAVISAKDNDGNVVGSCAVTVVFSDVADPSRYFYEPVYWALENGITTGAGGAGKFSPDDNCTREQIVTFLWRLMGEQEPTTYTSFTDVPENAWYYKPICWAAEKGITVGLNDGTGRFGVGQACTRAMCVTFLWRAAGKPAPATQGNFTDMRPGAYYVDAVSWAAEKNITVGLNDGTGRFGVDNTCTRAMIVTFLYRFAHMS